MTKIFLAKCLRARRLRTERGISLTELLVVLVLVGSAVVSATPFLQTFIRRSRLDAAAREVGMTMLAARLQAVRSGINVGVWISTQPSARAYRRLVVFEDTNANGVLDTNEPVTRTYEMPPETSRLFLRIDAYDSQAPSATPGDYNLAFSLFGSAVMSGAAGATLGVFVMDDNGNILQVGVPTGVTGRVAMTKLDRSATTAPFYVSTPWEWY